VFSSLKTSENSGEEKITMKEMCNEPQLMLKSKRMTCEAHGEMRNAYTILIAKTAWEDRRTWKDNIKMQVSGIGFGSGMGPVADLSRT